MQLDHEIEGRIHNLQRWADGWVDEKISITQSLDEKVEGIKPTE